MNIGKLDPDNRVIVIAEIGSNHNGDFILAKEMTVAAVECGVDAIKFQTYKAEKLLTKDVPAFPRAKLLGYKNQFDRFKNLEFSDEQFYELYELTQIKNIIFLSTPFDNDSVDFLNPMVPAFKVASGDLINKKLLRHIAAKDKPVILSTGQANIEEINSAVNIFKPDKLALMHCVSSYPTPDEQASLRSISFLKSQYCFPVGYSDHTIGILGCIAAVAMGAQIIEKHFTFDKTQNYGDHILSAEPDDMRMLVEEIRRLEKMLGKEEKICQPCEEPSKRQLRRTLHVNCAVSVGTVLDDAMIIPLISATGIPADRIDQVLSRKVRRNMDPYEALKEEDLS